MSKDMSLTPTADSQYVSSAVIATANNISLKPIPAWAEIKRILKFPPLGWFDRNILLSLSSSFLSLHTFFQTQKESERKEEGRDDERKERE